ncbi:MAG: (E)-4-hydroxy-3-methylbut-2-enyl-diphosphate synthase [Parachlamydiales bacterium]|nr:(E)-4-hydroxy-3-methylbut-2-enyl-diphosphate synthase [Parachlamydiales bacterium]
MEKCKAKIFKTRVVKIKNIEIGGDNPIRIQSMTNTKTDDVIKTADQIMKLQDAGCEIARVTVQGQKEAYACEGIKNILIKKGYSIPLVADIHFYPPAAMIAADYVDKIRINPGNYAEKRANFKNFNLTEKEYNEELLKVEEKLLPLIDKLKKNKVALRIGVNLGSLSDRIMSRYGNTIKGMIESAIEYTNILRKYDFQSIVYSMKTSNALLTIEAYRTLVKEMIKLRFDYPLHLGVTEAGDMEDGIIKSFCGMGPLLLDGIGDTIRVSLTEDPVKEIEPARNLSKLFKKQPCFSFLDFDKKQRKNEKVRVCIRSDNNTLYFEDDQTSIPIYKADDKIENKNDLAIEITNNDDFKKIKDPSYIILNPKSCLVCPVRSFFKSYKESFKNTKVIINFQYKDALKASSEISLLIYDNLIDAILVEKSSKPLAFDILQALGIKRYKTEFISCPGCGRTLFDIQKSLKLVKEKTSHLKDLKIAVMGCIVNGPGEMQDADFGVVGAGNNKVDLYYNAKCVYKNIDENIAVDKLISLIKENNKWVDPITSI